jgi:hypothetical protein
VRVLLAPAERQGRLRGALILAGLALWMAYTRLYFAVPAAHAALPACPFLTLTSHPCPFCGGTRSFAYMWRGDLSRAMSLHPLGPLLFGGALAVMVLLAVALITGREVRVSVAA